MYIYIYIHIYMYIHIYIYILCNVLPATIRIAVQLSSEQACKSAGNLYRQNIPSQQRFNTVWDKFHALSWPQPQACRGANSCAGRSQRNLSRMPGADQSYLCSKGNSTCVVCAAVKPWTGAEKSQWMGYSRMPFLRLDLWSWFLGSQGLHMLIKKTSLSASER